MRVEVVLAIALLGTALAAPQLRLSHKSFLGLEQALAGRVPVSVYSANRIYKGYEGDNNNVVLLNIPGLTHIIGEDDFASHESNDIEFSTGGVPLPVVRRKRQTGDEEEEEDDPFEFSRGEELAFALSSVGTLFGANFGRWFDESYDANVKFFDGLEVTGTLVLNQLDEMLAEPKEI